MQGQKTRGIQKKKQGKQQTGFETQFVAGTNWVCLEEGSLGLSFRHLPRDPSRTANLPRKRRRRQQEPELPDLAWKSQTSFSQTSATTRNRGWRVAEKDFLSSKFTCLVRSRANWQCKNLMYIGCTRSLQGGRTLRKDVFLPSKHLLSAFYKTLPSKNPSKNPCPYWKPSQAPSKNPSKKPLLLKNLLRTLLRGVRLHDPLGVYPSIAKTGLSISCPQGGL